MGEDKDIEQQDPTKEALEAGVKAAANAYAGPIGGKVAEAAMKTEAGQQLMNKGVQNAKNTIPGGLGKSKKKSGSLTNNLSQDNSQDSTSDTSSSESSSEEEISSSSSASGLGSISNLASKKKKLTLIAIICGAFLSFMLIVIIISILLVPFKAIGDFVMGTWDKIVDYFVKSNVEYEEEYYSKLKSTQENINKKYGVCIDINLITAALTVNQTFDQSILEATGDSEEELEFEDESDTPYKKMKKQVEILAKMQIKTKNYSLDGLRDSYCIHKDETGIEQEELVTDSNLSSCNDCPLGTGVSATPDLVSRNDEFNNFKKFFMTKSSEEQNNEWYIYRPYYKEEQVWTGYYETKDGRVVFDENGNKIKVYKTTYTCKKDYAEEQLPSKTYEISIGDYATRKDNVFYWNLVNQFIPDYYSDLLDSLTESERNKKIIEIADNIYLLYKTTGPSMKCDMDCYSVAASDVCPSGVEANGSLVTFEEYIAGVATAENGGSGPEAMKAQAIAARSYAMATGNWDCNASSLQQAYKEPSQEGIDAANSTAGVVIYKDGSIKRTEFSAAGVVEVTDTEYVLKEANGQRIPKTDYEAVTGPTYRCLCKTSCSGVSINNFPSECLKDGKPINTSHGRGMSQYGAIYLENQGYTYVDILKFYYGDDISLVSTSESNSDADLNSRRIVRCSSRSGSSPTGDFVSGMCIASKTRDYRNHSLNPDYRFWDSKLNAYNTLGGSLSYECTWYAFGRAMQVLVNNGGFSDDDAYNLLHSAMPNAHAKDWYKNASTNGILETSNSLYDLREGSIISMNGGAVSPQYGHVAFVESVSYDSFGKAKTFTTTERSGDSCKSNTYTISSASSAKIGNRSFSTAGVIFILGG